MSDFAGQLVQAIFQLQDQWETQSALHRSTQRGEESLVTWGLSQPRQRRPHWEVRSLQSQALAMRDRVWPEQEMQPLRGCAEVGTLEHAQDLASTFSGSQNSVMSLNGLMTELAF